MNMNGMALSKAPASLKLFATAMLLVVGLIYLTLLVHIWITPTRIFPTTAFSYSCSPF
jgi:uncharacterized membrane protein